MKRIIPIGFAATALAGAITLGSVQAENRSGVMTSAPVSPITNDIVFHDEAFPIPVSGNDLMDSAPKDQKSVCIGAEQVLGVFALDVEHVGGEILALTDGLEQAFADSWRKTVGLPKVNVSQVFAHVVRNEEGAGVVDVVEIDAKGCAMSRTLLAIDDWLLLLEPLQSLEV